MFRRFALVPAAIVLTATVFTASVTLAVGAFERTPASYFFPSPADVNATCHRGYQAANLTSRAFSSLFEDYYAALGDYSTDVAVKIQSTLGAVFSVCRSDALSLKPESASPTSDVFMVIIKGVVDTPTEASDWAAALVAVNAKGKEIARAFPAESQRGLPLNWKADCTGAQCVFRGSNYYYFEHLVGTDFGKAVQAGAKVTVLAQRGYGIETFDIPGNLK